MFLALREIRHSKPRFGLITGVIVMVSSLVFILVGLANGLATGQSAALDALPIDAMVISSGSDYQLDRSSLSSETVQSIRRQAGVTDASPFGATATNVKLIRYGQGVWRLPYRCRIRELCRTRAGRG
jgi:putative ABC transport system permease protein